MKKELLFTLAMFISVLNSCSNDDKVLNDIFIEKPTIELISGESEQIAATSNLDLIYSSEDEYFASVNNTGKVTAKRIGETKIIVENAEKSTMVNVVIKPKYTTYPDPDLLFGETKSSVISKLGTPTSNTGSAILYDGYSAKAPMIIYMFDGELGNSKVNGVGVIVRTTYTEELAAFLDERYYMTVGSGDVTLIGFNHIDMDKASISLGVSMYNLSYWMVGYLPFSNSVRSMHSPIGMNDFKINMEQMLK